MSELRFDLGPDAVSVTFDEALYPKDAIYGAAYVFIDRCYVHLDRAADRRIQVTLRAKKKDALDPQAIAGEFENELLGQAWRRQIADENRQFIESITTRALGGAAGPPGLDELLAADIGESTAFDDPLGIAMSWEEKYAKKKPQAETEPRPQGSGQDTAKAGASGPTGGSDPK